MERNQLQDLCFDVAIELNVRKWDSTAWNGFIWLGIGKEAGLLQETSGFKTRRGHFLYRLSQRTAPRNYIISYFVKTQSAYKQDEANRRFSSLYMDLQEVGGSDGDWMEFAQDRDRWRELVSTVKNLWVP
jgi:hypothetical protein